LCPRRYFQWIRIRPHRQSKSQVTYPCRHGHRCCRYGGQSDTIRTDAAVPFLGLPNIRSFHCCIAWLRSTPRLWSAPILHADECNFCSGKRLVFFEAPQSFSFLPFLLGYHKFTFSSTDYSRFRSLPYGAVQASIFSSPTIVLLSAFFCWVITILLSHLQSVQISAIWSSSG